MEIVRYADFVKSELLTKDIDSPFTAEQITAQAVSTFKLDKSQIQYGINLALNRLVGKDILRLAKGVYYRPKKTVFGLMPISYKEMIYQQYVETKLGLIGYITGPTLAHKLGLTTQMSKYSYFVSNEISGRDKLIEGAGVILRSPSVLVSEDNFRYLQVLDLLENKDGIYFEIDEPKLKFVEIIENFQLDFYRLLAYAKLYYTQNVLEQIIDLAVTLSGLKKL